MGERKGEVVADKAVRFNLLFAMSEKMKNLAVRALSGAVLAVVTVGAILLSKWTYGALLLAILAGGMYETYRLAACNGARPQYGMGLAAGVALFAVNFFAGTGLLETTDLPRLLTLYFLVMLPAVFICELFRRLERPETNVGATLLGVGYVALPLSLMCYIPAVGGVWQPWTMIAFVFIIWANDVCAYLIGMTLGRHPLCERISPKKTWEGFLGGLAGAVGTGLAAARFLDADPWHWAGLALVAAVAGVLGDLVESMFKRSAGVKDSGGAIPGHGGVLDRFDALLLAAPFVFVYMVLVRMI